MSPSFQLKEWHKSMGNLFAFTYKITRFNIFIYKKNKPRLSFMGLYNILITTELIMGLLWLTDIINFADKTDNCVILGSDI